MGNQGAAAADRLIPTKAGVIRFGRNPAAGRLFKQVSKKRFILPSDTPLSTGGTLAVTAGNGSLSCYLPRRAFDATEGWKALGNPPGAKGYKYINKLAPGGSAGPCRMLVVKQNTIAGVSKGTEGLPVPAAGYPQVSVVLILGADRYCALWRMPHLKEKADRLIRAKDQPAPIHAQA